MVFVQFADKSQKIIISEFGCAQDAAVFQNQGEVKKDEPRYLAFLSLTIPHQ